MSLKEQLLTHGYDHIDILLIDDQENQTTVPNISLHKITDLEYKLYLKSDSIDYHLNHEHPYFKALKKDEKGRDQLVKGFILEW